MAQKFYICKTCGKIIDVINETKIPTVCCGQKMEELIAGTTDASLEKHVPVVAVENGIVTVTVGAVSHPMIEEHYIEWIVLETKNGVQKKYLAPGSAPVATFAITNDDEVVTAFAYCNLHSLWKF